MRLYQGLDGKLILLLETGQDLLYIACNLKVIFAIVWTLDWKSEEAFVWVQSINVT